MSYNEHSAEVAEDYRHALEDLTMNSRYEITNLTVVARENTEHALAISEALQDHIKKVIRSSSPATCLAMRQVGRPLLLSRDFHRQS
jgi:pre-mRNA cleavage complex 2 protein Pcf11